MAKFYGKSVSELINGTSGNDSIWGNAGADTLKGGAGNDFIWGGDQDSAKDLIYGGTGNDTIGGDAGDDTLYGEDGNDSIYGGSGNDTLDGGTCDDLLTGESGNDSMLGGTGNDRLFGGSGNDSMRGGNGDDYIQGDDTDVVNNVTVQGYSATGSKVDVNFHETGNTVDFEGSNIKGGRFSAELDYIKGTGSEKLVVDFGANNVTEVSFKTELFFAQPNDVCPEILKWRALDDCGNVVGQGTFKGSADGNHSFTVTTKSPFTAIEFTASDNGSKSADNSDYKLTELTYKTLATTGYNDYLSGGDGNDVLLGMSGNDRLDGGADTGKASLNAACTAVNVGCIGDYLTGGSGKDTFAYFKGDGVDQITDFTVGEDHLRLVGFGNDFNSAVKGHLYQQGSDTVVYFGTDSAIVLKNVDVADLHTSDFLYA